MNVEIRRLAQELIALECFSSTEIGTKLAELASETGAHRVSDGFDPNGEPAYPTTIAGIRALMRALEQDVGELDQLRKLEAELTEQQKRMSARGGARERVLGRFAGWLGGDAELGARLGKLRELAGSLSESIEQKSNDVAALGARIDEAVARDLAGSYDSFRKLRVEAAAARSLAQATLECAKALGNAIDACAEAARAKRADAATDAASFLTKDMGAIRMFDRADDLTSGNRVREAHAAIDAFSRSYEVCRSKGQATVAAGGVQVPSGLFDFAVDTIQSDDLAGMFSARMLAHEFEAIAEALRKIRAPIERAKDSSLASCDRLTERENELIRAHRERIENAPLEVIPARGPREHPMLQVMNRAERS